MLPKKLVKEPCLSFFAESPLVLRSVLAPLRFADIIDLYFKSLLKSRTNLSRQLNTLTIRLHGERFEAMSNVLALRIARLPNSKFTDKIVYFKVKLASAFLYDAPHRPWQEIRLVHLFSRKIGYFQRNTRVGLRFQGDFHSQTIILLVAIRYN